MLAIQSTEHQLLGILVDLRLWGMRTINPIELVLMSAHIPHKRQAPRSHAQDGVCVALRAYSGRLSKAGLCCISKACTRAPERTLVRER